MFSSLQTLINSKNVFVGMNAKTLGYYASGDGGGNEYEIVASGTGTVDGGRYIDLVGISGQAKGLFPGDVVNVRQFGAKGDNISDDTVPIQSAINYNGIVTIKDGNYLVSNLSFTANNSGIIGEGRSCRILSNSTTSDIFTIGNGTTEISGLIFRDFSIWASVVKTAGHCFNCRFITDSLFDYIFLGSLDDYGAAGNTHKLWDGIYFDKFSQIVLNSGEIVVANDGIKTRGQSDQSFGAELSISGGCRAVHLGGKGIHLGGASGGVYLGRIDFSLCRYGVYVDDTLQPGKLNRELFISNECTIDTCTGWGINIKNNGLDTLESPGCWISGCGNATTGEGGIRVEPTTGASLSAKWGDVRIQNCYSDGFLIESGIHSIGGGFIRSNGLGTPGGNGITLNSPGVLNCSGTTFHNNGNATKGRGIDIAAGCDQFTISSNTFFSNGIGPIRNLSSVGTTKIIRNNNGYVSENQGTATILSGNTTVNVSHGLTETPTNVLISFAGGQDGGAYAFVTPGSITSTIFTITYSVSAGINRDFWWRAIRA